MKMKAAKTIGLLISMLILFASCGQLAGSGESRVSINLPYVNNANSRAVSSDALQRIKGEHASYRVHINDRVLEGAGGNFSATFPVGVRVDVFIECVNAKGEVILRTVTKSLVVASGENTINFNLKADGNEVTPPVPPSPVTEYINITFNQGFVYTNTVHQSPSTWQAMTGASLPNSGQREKGSPVSQDQASATGYVFKGWVESNVQPSGDAPDTQSFNYVQKYDSDMTLYAIWEQIEPGSHSVKFAGGTTTGSSASGLPQGFQQKEGTQATFSGTPTCPGYEFAGWNANVPGVSVTQAGNSWTFTMPTSDVTLTAQWNVITYTLSYEANDGQATPAQTETFTVDAGGTNLTLKAANTFTRTGYTFANWTAGGSNSYNPSTDVAKTSLMALATGNGTNRTITITAVWTANTYKITYSNTNGGTGNASTTGATTSFTIETQNITLATEGTLEKIAYQFDGWETADGTSRDVNNMNASQLIALITSGDTLALQVKWIDGKRTVLYPDGTLIINELPNARRQDTPTVVYAAMKDDGSNYRFNSSSPWYDNRASITSVEIGNDISPTSTANWFYGMSYCTSMNLTRLNTSKVTTMSSMFQSCSKLTNLDLSSFDTSKVTTMNLMFKDCGSLINLNLSSFDTSNVTDMSSMFYNLKLTNLDLGNFDTSKVTSMACMFQSCAGLASLNLSNFNTSRVKTMNYMFSGCSGLTNITFGQNFDISSATIIYGMFAYCSKLTSLDLSSFNTSKVTDIKSMFSNCSKLATIYVGSGFVTDSVTDGSGMFNNCTALVGGSGTAYDANNPTDTTYARIDGGTDAPGYFTEKQP